MRPDMPPAFDHATESESTHRLIEAIAQDMWARYSRDGTLNWAGVEHHLDRIVRQARIGVRSSAPASLSERRAARTLPAAREPRGGGTIERGQGSAPSRLGDARGSFDTGGRVRVGHVFVPSRGRPVPRGQAAGA